MIVQAGKDVASKLGYPEGPITRSNGWQHKLRIVSNLPYYRIHGESGSADDIGSDLELDIAAIQAKIQTYQPKVVYDMDETVLMDRTPPITTIASRPIDGLKQDKTRITVTRTVNDDEVT